MTVAGPPPPPLTGERTVPGVEPENYWFRRHEVIYQWLIESLDLTRDVPPDLSGQSRPPTIVDAGCGEGYGAEMLARAGAQCLAVDLDQATVAHVRRAHARPPDETRPDSRAGVRPVVVNLDALPLPDESVDAVVSLQVIEHLWDLPRFLRECVRILRPGGRLVVSTPNRLTFSPGLGRGEKPLNPFHREEFDAGQLLDLFDGAGLTATGVIGLRHGPRIELWEREHGSLPTAQVRAITSGRWDPELAEFVSSVTCADFVVDSGTRRSLDLIATGTRRPSPEPMS